MKFTTKLTTGIAAASAAALGVGLLAFAPGVGANFVQKANATANISVGSFNCQFIYSPGVSISDQGHTATLSLNKIQASSGSETATLTLKNTGTMPMIVEWVAWTDGVLAQTLGSIAPIVPQQGATLAAGAQNGYTVGAQWSGLGNADLGAQGTINYQARCLEPSQAANIAFYTLGGAYAVWNGSNVDLTVPKGADRTAYTAIVVNNPPASLPSTEPNVTVSNAISYALNNGKSNPYFQVAFNDGSTLFGWPNAAGHIYKWVWRNPEGTDTALSGWAAAMAQAAGNGVSYVQFGPTNGGNTTDSNGVATNTVTYSVSCFKWGTTTFGSGC